MERIEGIADPLPDRGSRVGRKLLAADDGGKPRKTRLATTQRGLACDLCDPGQMRVGRDQRGDGLVEIGLRVQV